MCVCVFLSCLVMSDYEHFSFSPFLIIIIIMMMFNEKKNWPRLMFVCVCMCDADEFRLSSSDDDDNDVHFLVFSKKKKKFLHCVIFVVVQGHFHDSFICVCFCPFAILYCQFLFSLIISGFHLGNYYFLGNNNNNTIIITTIEK